MEAQELEQKTPPKTKAPARRPTGDALELAGGPQCACWRGLASPALASPKPSSGPRILMMSTRSTAGISITPIVVGLSARLPMARRPDRKSVVEGKSVDLKGR